MDVFLLSDLHTGDIIDELHHDSNDEEFSFITDYLPIINADEFEFEVE